MFSKIRRGSLSEIYAFIIFSNYIIFLFWFVRWIGEIVFHRLLCPLRSPTAGGVGFGRAWTSSNDGGRSEARQRQSCAARVGPQAAPATCRHRAAMHGPITSVSVGSGQSRRRQSVSQACRTAPPGPRRPRGARSSARRRVSRGGQKRNRGPPYQVRTNAPRGTDAD